MYKIKSIPEDFIVKELGEFKILDKGAYSYYTLIKKNYTTQRAIDTIANTLKVQSKFIGFSGTKDKNALTYQTISIKNTTHTSNLKLKDLELIYLGKNSEPISLGTHNKNGFIITVRNLEKSTIPNIKKIPNYFDDQRFSTNNVAVGLNIMRKDLKKAIELILDSDDDYHIREYLETHQNDFAGAIKKIPFRIQKFYINSVQSLLFNNIICKLLENHPNKKSVNYSQGTLTFLDDYESIDNKKIPLIGYASEFPDDNIRTLADKQLAEFNLTLRSFISRQLPDLSSEGDERDMFADVGNLNIGEFEKDDLNPDMFKTKIMFTLPKGSYATIVVKNLFS